MQLLAARVSKAPRQVKTKYGDRLVCDVTLPDGTETAIWGPVNYAPLEYLERGQAVTVSRDSKGKVHIIENHLTHPEMTAPTIPQPAAPSQGIDPDTKRAIADYVTEQAKLFGFCLSQASTIQGLQPDDIRPVATTLYLATQKRFGLN